ncbi:NADH/ubiquinone/plastoquinone (complex I) [Candidatus Binatia bacterium]|nr:NADH/ubiquinone/plastoquinone (complex I) [Candidatus Binatia bacterium]
MPAPNESVLPIGISVLLLVGAVLTVGFGLVRRRFAWPVAFATLVGVLANAVALLLAVLDAGPLRHSLGGWAAPIGIEYVVDGLGAFVVTVVAGIAVAVGWYARTAVRRETPDREVAFLGMLLTLLLGLTGMVLTGDLFNLYVFFEISALAGYALLAVGDRKAPVASFRYVLVGTTGASFYLLGIGLLYVLTGSLNMADVARLLPSLQDNPALRVALALIVVGVGVKMAVFPLFGWQPDAYTYACSTTTALIAPVMTKVAAFALLRVLFFVFGLDLVIHYLPAGAIFSWMSAAGIVVGSVMAIAQRDVKRMLAYSSIAQVGYIGVGLGLANPWALTGAMLHILNHATMKCCLFLVTGSVALHTGRTAVVEYDGLGRCMPWSFAAFTIAALAMVGLPPTNGFFSKWYLILGTIRSGDWGLVVVVAGSSLLTAVYFFRLLERVYTRAVEVEAGGVPTADAPLGLRVPALALGVGVVVLGLCNAWFVTEILQPALPVASRLPGM